MRLPKEIYFVHRVMQSEQPEIHILGHWTYPADTQKTIYVVANTQSVELFLNGKSLGANSNPTDGFVFAFPNVASKAASWRPWEAAMVTRCANMNSPQWAPPAPNQADSDSRTARLKADGQDVALLDVEVVDSQGRAARPTTSASISRARPGHLARRLQQRQTRFDQ